MTYLSQTDVSALEVTAMTAADYLDACDAGAKTVRLDPAYYQACGNLLMKIFSVAKASQNFPELLERSSAARDVAESVEIGRRIKLSRLGYYPELSVILNREIR
jgi:hypothetical protein